MTAAMQFAPVIGRKARAIFEAQQARGIALKPGWRALRNYPALMIPLLIQSFQLADALAEAMEGPRLRPLRPDLPEGLLHAHA